MTNRSVRLLAAPALAVAFWAAGCTQPDPPQVVTACGSSGVTPSLTCPALPNTTAVGEWVDAGGIEKKPQPGNGQKTDALLDYDLWAWNSFVAMNWPALDPAANNNQRGFPDLNKSFQQARHDDLTVWETFKEKREVFLLDYRANPPQPSTQAPLPWNSPPQYGPASAQIPCCPGADCSAPNLRELGSQSKLFFDTLDETAEVASEALEAREVSCAGWVDVDECIGGPRDNPCCTLQGHPVGPRVWRGEPAKGNPVVYEVKINYDSFSYITNTGPYQVATNQPLYNVANARAAAKTGSIRLPARTSAAAMPPQPGGGPGGTPGFNPLATGAGPLNKGYDAAKCLDVKSGTPCLAGAVHLKAAWLELGSGDDHTKYHTADAYQYSSNQNVEGGICKAPATFGLIGLHIIQRIHESFPAQSPPGRRGSSTGQARGGTYVFATWEHKNNEPGGFTYANYSSYFPGGSGGPLNPYPNVTGQPAAPAIPLTRLYKLLASTERANALVHQKLGCNGSDKDSVWCNYRLIGTQYAATQTPAPRPRPVNTLNPQQPAVEGPANSGQPYYLANLVVESNVGLQQFQGLPPSADLDVITVIPHYTSNNFPNHFSTTSFERNYPNVAFRTKKDTNHQFVMGGCMGCHGVAQLSGYSFSFVLLDNQYGAAPDTQDDFTIPPTPDAASN